MSVDVEKVDALRCKAISRVVERRPDNRRERRVIAAVVRFDRSESRLVVTPGVRIAAPMVDRVTTGAGLVFERRLAEGKITFAPISPELDEQTRFQLRDQVVGEKDMLRPRAESITQRFETARR